MYSGQASRKRAHSTTIDAGAPPTVVVCQHSTVIVPVEGDEVTVPLTDLHPFLSAVRKCGFELSQAYAVGEFVSVCVESDWALAPLKADWRSKSAQAETKLRADHIVAGRRRARRGRGRGQRKKWIVRVAAVRS